MKSILEEIKELNFRKELEIYVTANNKFLRERVKTMSYLQLLRNSHPAYRNNYARDCYKKELITKVEAAEFGIIN